MNIIALPLVLLGIATGIAIAQAPPRARAIAFVAFAAPCSFVASLALPVPRDTAAFACWSAIVLCAAAIHWPQAPRHLAFILACASGTCGGLLASACACRPECYVLPPALATLLLASWCLRHDARIAVNVVASWLIAVALLVANLHALPVTLGDRPDHLE